MGMGMGIENPVGDASLYKPEAVVHTVTDSDSCILIISKELAVNKQKSKTAKNHYFGISVEKTLFFPKLLDSERDLDPKSIFSNRNTNSVEADFQIFLYPESFFKFLFRS
jgi:hypothetical protein